MTIANGIVLYLIIWWISLFLFLPLGNKRPDRPELGHDPGAPVNPQLGRKFLYTTLFATVLWLLAYGFIVEDFISFVEESQ